MATVARAFETPSRYRPEGRPLPPGPPAVEGPPTCARAGSPRSQEGATRLVGPRPGHEGSRTMSDYAFG